jgi:hypothetical protein
MQNTTNQSTKTLNRKEKALKNVTESEELCITYQKFNGVYLAVISNLNDRQTHAYGRTKLVAGRNALDNFRLKYGTA